MEGELRHMLYSCAILVMTSCLIYSVTCKEVEKLILLYEARPRTTNKFIYFVRSCRFHSFETLSFCEFLSYVTVWRSKRRFVR